MTTLPIVVFLNTLFYKPGFNERPERITDNNQKVIAFVNYDCYK